MNKRHSVPFALFLALTLTTTSLSCGGGTELPEDGSTQDITETTAAVIEEYPYYEGNDLGGKTIKVLNIAKTQYDMICCIQPDEILGETVNDAIFNRNAYVKNKLNFELEEENEPTLYEMGSRLEKIVMSDDDEYSVVYMPSYLTTSGLSNGYYTCLDELENLHLDEKWWDQLVLCDTSLFGKHYLASSAAHLMGYDGLWCMYFNESMMDDLGLEYPYELVREGKWTLDRLSEYCAAAANLNGDESFSKTNRNCVFGMSSFYNSVMKFVFGMGGNYIGKDKDDAPVFEADSRHFMEVCEKLAGFFSRDGEYCAADDDRTPESAYTTLFREQRAFFLGGEVKNAQGFRDLDWQFGVVPFPKYDETQETYRSTPLHQCAVFTIPVSSKNTEEAALVFDALSYESDAKVLDLYFGVMVEQKGLRNQDSIDMLNIIKECRSFDIGISLWLADNLRSAVEAKLAAGSTDIASVIAEKRQAVEANIEKLTENLSN